MNDTENRTFPYRTLQIFLAGVSTSLAIPALGKNHGIPGARPLLALAVFFNLLNALCVFGSIAAYMAIQNRTSDELNNCECQKIPGCPRANINVEYAIADKLPDVVAPVPAALCSMMTQIFMSIRCYRVCRKKAFLALIGLCLLALLGGMVWTTVENGERACPVILLQDPEQAIYSAVLEIICRSTSHLRRDAIKFVVECHHRPHHNHSPHLQPSSAAEGRPDGSVIATMSSRRVSLTVSSAATI